MADITQYTSTGRIDVSVLSSASQHAMEEQILSALGTKVMQHIFTHGPQHVSLQWNTSRRPPWYFSMECVATLTQETEAMAALLTYEAVHP